MNKLEDDPKKQKREIKMKVHGLLEDELKMLGTSK